MADESTILSLLGGVEFDDARLYSLLEILARDVYRIDRQLNPPITQAFSPSGISIGIVPSVQNFNYEVFPTNVRLVWDEIPGASYYEIKYFLGIATDADWDDANSIIKTSTVSANVNPITLELVYGDHSFLIKAFSNIGIESSTATISTLTVIQIHSPSVTATVIDNNVLLNWTIPDSQFLIDYYNVYKDGVFRWSMDGTFEAIFETTSGTYEYGVEAVDIVGNVSDRGTFLASVSQPPDYVLTDFRVSDLSGTKVNTIVRDVHGDICLLCNVSTTDTWDDHFTSRSWATIQDQLDDGYPYYAQPTEMTGSYEEIIDYGAIISNTIVTFRWSETHISGSMNVVPKMAVSDDGVTYSSFVTTSSFFYSSLRYLKIRFEFTADDDTDLLEVCNLSIFLDVRRETDSGYIMADEDDVSGTQVLFAKPFIDVESIVATAESPDPITVIYEFVDVPNPTEFFLYAFDDTGTRVTIGVSWIVRGII